MTLEDALMMALIEIETATPSELQELPESERLHHQERKKVAQQLLQQLEQSPLPWRATCRPLQGGAALPLPHQSSALH